MSVVTADAIADARKRLGWTAYHQRLAIADRRTSRLVPYQPNAVQRRLAGTFRTCFPADWPSLTV